MKIVRDNLADPIKADPGDIIRLVPPKGSSLAGQLKLSNLHGTVENPIVIDCEGVTIQGNYKFPLGNNAADTSKDFTTFFDGPKRPLEFCWAGLLHIENCSNLVIQSPTLRGSRGRGVLIEKSKNIETHNIDLAGARNALLVPYESENISFFGGSVTDGGNFFPYRRSSSVVNWPVGIMAHFCKGVLFDGLDISYHWGEGAGTGRESKNITYRNNTVHDCAMMLFYMHMGYDHFVHDNLFYNTVGSPYSRGLLPGSAIVWNQEGRNFPDFSAGNLKFNGNIVHVHNSSALDIWNNQGTEKRTDGIEIRGNTFIASGTGLSLELSTDGMKHSGIIENNVFYQLDGKQPTSGQHNKNPKLLFQKNVWSKTPEIKGVSHPDDVIEFDIYTKDQLALFRQGAQRDKKLYQITDESMVWAGYRSATTEPTSPQTHKFGFEGVLYRHSKVQPGDTVEIRPGVYKLAEFLKFDTPGVTYTSDGLVTVAGSHTSPLPEFGGQFSAELHHKPAIETLSITAPNCTFDVALRIQDVQGDGMVISPSAQHCTFARDVEITNCGTVYGAKEYSIGGKHYAFSVDQILTGGAGILIRGSDITFHCLTIWDCGGDCVQIAGAAGITFEKVLWFNTRIHSAHPEEPFNAASHSDGLQVFEGGISTDIRILQGTIGPLLTNGVMLGQADFNGESVACVVEMTIQDTFFSGIRENPIRGEIGAENNHWVIDFCAFASQSPTNLTMYTPTIEIKNCVLDGEIVVYLQSPAAGGENNFIGNGVTGKLPGSKTVLSPIKTSTPLQIDAFMKAGPRWAMVEIPNRIQSLTAQIRDLLNELDALQ